VVQNQITDGCDSISTVQIPKSSGQVCRKIEKQPRRKNLMLCRKRSMNKMLTSSPSVIDPDLDDFFYIPAHCSLESELLIWSHSHLLSDFEPPSCPDHSFLCYLSDFLHWR
jgi:hypothetical protein